MRKRKRWDKCGTLFAWRGQEVVAEHCDVPDRHASESPGPHLPLLSAEERSSCFPQLCTFIAFLRRPITHIFLVLPSHSQYSPPTSLRTLVLARSRAENRSLLARISPRLQDDGKDTRGFFRRPCHAFFFSVR
jgi:hypothetical protein